MLMYTFRTSHKSWELEVVFAKCVRCSKAKKIFFCSTATRFSGRASQTFVALGGGTIPFQR